MINRQADYEARVEVSGCGRDLRVPRRITRGDSSRPLKRLPFENAEVDRNWLDDGCESKIKSVSNLCGKKRKRRSLPNNNKKTSKERRGQEGRDILSNIKRDMRYRRGVCRRWGARIQILVTTRQVIS